MRDIGKNIRALRTRRGLSQDQLAEALHVTRQTVSNYETGRSRPDVEMLTALESGDYGRYQDLLAQYNSDRNFSYGQYRDLVGDDRYGLEWRYGVGRDQIADQRYEDETAYNREQDAWNRQQYEDETEYNRALERAQTLAQAGDFSGYRTLGYSDSEIASLQNAYNRALAAASLSRSGGGNRSSNNGNSGSQDYDGLFQAAMESGHPKSFISNNYKRYGFTSSTGLYDDYESWADEAASGDSGTTSLDWDQDEGIFTWNGQRYIDLNDLAEDISNANLSDAQLRSIQERLSLFGFDVDIT